MIQLATALRFENRSSEADSFTNKALEIFKKKNGSCEPECASEFSDAAKKFALHAKPELAADSYKQALKKGDDKCTKEQLASTLTDYAKLHIATGDEKTAGQRRTRRHNT